MKFTENRKVASIVLTAVIVCTLFIGGGSALNSQAKDVEAVFWSASESISAELNEMLSDAQVMSGIAARYKDIDAKLVDDVNTAAQKLADAGKISGKYETANKLTQAVEALYTAGSAVSMNDNDASDFRYNYKNYSSAQLRIGHDPYNDEAAAYNKEVSDPLAGLIGSVWGAGKAQIFG